VTTTRRIEWPHSSGPILTALTIKLNKWTILIGTFILNFLVFAALYSALTYIVPFLENVTGISGPLIRVFLLAYGVATAVGSFGGGRFADQNTARTLVVATIGTAVCLLALYLVGAIAFLVALVLLAWACSPSAWCPRSSTALSLFWGWAAHGGHRDR
jgi:predicted MFS family arabinose efflux permease